jgi:hypothetical protein
MRLARARVGVLAIAGAFIGPGCNPPVNPAGEALKAPTSGDAFEGVKCSAVRPQTEPDLMAWDPGSRANLNRLRHRGVVAVRYEAKGCNVELELLSQCIGTAKYEFSPYSANDHKVAHNESELYASLPVGAARLSGKVKGTRALRTDYMLAGQYALPPDAMFKRTDLHGSDCARATHVVSALYVGAFAMAAGEQRAMDGRASLFGLSAGGSSGADVEVIGDEGNSEACKASQKDGKESEQCGVPLRVGLAPLDASTAPMCPEGSVLQGDKCVRKNVVTQVDCPAGTKWDGSKCTASVDMSCAAGLHFEAGQGCIPNVLAPPNSGAPQPVGQQAAVSMAELLDRAGAARRTGDYPASIKLYDQVLQGSPTHVEANAGKGDCLRASGDLRGAKALYQRALASSPDFGPARIGLADTEWGLGEYAGAIKDYKTIVERLGDNAPQRAKERAAGLDQAGVERVAANNRAAIKRACWERGGSEKSPMNVTVTLNLGPGGDVVSASSVGDDPVVAKCVEAQARSWRFPAPGSNTTVNVPFKFQRQ